MSGVSARTDRGLPRTLPDARLHSRSFETTSDEEHVTVSIIAFKSSASHASAGFHCQLHISMAMHAIVTYIYEQVS
jgi:hypothetical protein